MRKINRIIIQIVIMLFLYSCSGVSDVGKTLRNEKVKTTDEFLVKKRKPLSLPPNYEDLPEPRSETKDKENTNDNINTILKIQKKQTTKKGSNNVEQSIINQIRK